MITFTASRAGVPTPLRLLVLPRRPGFPAFVLVDGAGAVVGRSQLGEEGRAALGRAVRASRVAAQAVRRLARGTGLPVEVVAKLLRCGAETEA